MADKKTRRLAPKILKEDLDALDALDSFEDYAPSNPQYSKANSKALRDELRAKQAKETQDQRQANASRDAAVMGEWDIHEFVQGAGFQIKAQYGENSDQYAAIGYKKKIEYKTPSRKPKRNQT